MKNERMVIEHSRTGTSKASHKKTMTDGFTALTFIQIAWFCSTVLLVFLGKNSFYDSSWKIIFTNSEMIEERKKKSEILPAIGCLFKTCSAKSSTEKGKKTKEKKVLCFLWKLISRWME